MPAIGPLQNRLYSFTMRERGKAHEEYGTMATSRISKWVLVAGTGDQSGLPAKQVWCAEAIGKTLARHNYGLVVGGWHGVDYIAAKSFSEALVNTALSDALIQVTPTNSQPAFPGGHVIQVPSGSAEWVEALRYADAVVLIGGKNGTYETYKFALQERRPVFPIANSGGDAFRAFDQITSNWEQTGGIWWGVPRNTFSKVLSRHIKLKEDATSLAELLLGLCAYHFRAHDPALKKRLFISYSRKDRDWLVALKKHLSGFPSDWMSIWDDSYIEPGSDWDRKIREALATSRAAVLLVTPNFLASEYIARSELPILLNAARDELMSIFWVHAEQSDLRDSQLSQIQAAHDTSRALSDLSPAAQNDVLGEIARKIIGDMQVERTSTPAR
jgi:hypothetical protein